MIKATTLAAVLALMVTCSAASNSSSDLLATFAAISLAVAIDVAMIVVVTLTLAAANVTWIDACVVFNNVAMLALQRSSSKSDTSPPIVTSKDTLCIRVEPGGRLGDGEESNRRGRGGEVGDAGLIIGGSGGCSWMEPLPGVSRLVLVPTTAATTITTRMPITMPSRNTKRLFGAGGNNGPLSVCSSVCNVIA
jgi:hypothetical protein